MKKIQDPHNAMSILFINAELKRRDKLLDAQKIDTKPDTEIDNIQKAIMRCFKANFIHYPVDFIIETLTRFGDSPSILYDDNGLFCVTSDGMQPVVSGRQRIEGAFTSFVEKQQWKKTIRLALKHYLKIR